MIKKFVLLLVFLGVSFADESSGIQFIINLIVVRKIPLRKKYKNGLNIPLQYNFLLTDTKTLSITDYQNVDLNIINNQF